MRLGEGVAKKELGERKRFNFYECMREVKDRSDWKRFAYEIRKV